MANPFDEAQYMAAPEWVVTALRAAPGVLLLGVEQSGDSGVLLRITTDAGALEVDSRTLNCDQIQSLMPTVKVYESGRL